MKSDVQTPIFEVHDHKLPVHVSSLTTQPGLYCNCNESVSLSVCLSVCLFVSVCLFPFYQTCIYPTLCPTKKFCVVPACSTSRTSFASEYWVFSVTSTDFEAMYQQTRSYKSAPRRGMVSGLHRSGDTPVADRRPPGPTRSATNRCNSDRGPAASGGTTVLANDHNGRRLRLNTSRHDDDDDDFYHFLLLHFCTHSLS